MREDPGISESIGNLAVTITALFSGIFVVAGGAADKVGRVKITYLGLASSVAGSLLIALSPVGMARFLIAGWIIQELSAACVMPATLAMIKAYSDGAQRQAAVTCWSIGSWGGSGVSALFRVLMAPTLGWRRNFWMPIAVAVLSYTPPTDAALSNVPNEKAGAASGIYKMASSLGAAFGLAISDTIFTSLSGIHFTFKPLSDLFLGRTDNVEVRFAAAAALLFKVIWSSLL